MSLRQRAVRVVALNNGGIGRRIIISRRRGGLQRPSVGPGSFPGPAGHGSQQAAVGETRQTRKVGLGQRGAGRRRAEAREHRARVERGPVPAALARGGGEAQAAEGCGVRLQQQRGGEYANQSVSARRIKTCPMGNGKRVCLKLAIFKNNFLAI